MKRISVILALICILVSVSDRTVQAQTLVSIELVLAIDTSASVNDAEYALQMSGIAWALRSPDVIALIGRQNGVAITLIQWSSWVGSASRIPWRLLTDPASVQAFAAEVEAAPRENAGNLTAIGTAIDAAVVLIETNDYFARRMTIDISGDGQSNAGLPLIQSRLNARSRQITVNGLAILTDFERLDTYFRQQVITGTGAFVVTTNDYSGFAEAMRLKLLSELAPTDVVELRLP